MKQKIKRVIGLYLHYLHSMKRNPARIIEILVWPSFEVVLFGLLASSGINRSSDVAAITVVILVGIVYWNCTARIIHESVAQFIDDFFSKNIQNIFISPVTIPELLLALTAASMTKIVASLIALSVVLFFVFPSFIASIGVQSLIWVLQLELFGVALSFIAVSLVFLMGQRASFAGWMISTIVQIFSLVFYERAALPTAFRFLSYAVPSSYIFESLRTHRPGDPALTMYEFVALLLTIIYLLIGTLAVRTSFQWARRYGTLIKT